MARDSLLMPVIRRLSQPASVSQHLTRLRISMATSASEPQPPPPLSLLQATPILIQMSSPTPPPLPQPLPSATRSQLPPPYLHSSMLGQSEQRPLSAMRPSSRLTD